MIIHTTALKSIISSTGWKDKILRGLKRFATLILNEFVIMVSAISKTVKVTSNFTLIVIMVHGSSISKKDYE